MNKIKNKITLGILILGFLIFNACGSKSNNSNNSISNDQDMQSVKEDNIDGLYSGSQNISGMELNATLTISGSRWSAKSQLGYDNSEYQNGVVKGNDLYDESGMLKIGYVSGNTAHINGYPTMRK